MSKVLIVYYSLTGNTKFIAETIAETINADVLELKPKKELNAESGMKYMWGGAQATMKKKPKLKDFSINPLEYDLIFLGTPVWAWTFSPPLRSFLSIFDLSNKKLALWTCNAGDGEKAMGRFKKALTNSTIVGTIRFQDPLRNNTEEAKKQAASWAKEVVESIEM